MKEKIRNFFKKNPKFKNPVFWGGLISLIFAAAQIDFMTLTSWNLFRDAVLAILGNPVAIVAVIINIASVFNDNGTPGLDKLNK